MVADMVKRIPLWGLASLAILLANSTACGPGGSAFQGTWKGKRDRPTQPNESPYVAETLRKVELIVKGDHFELLDYGIPLSGRIQVSGESATLRVDRAFDRPVDSKPTDDQAPSAKIQNGKLSFSNPSGEDPTPVVLTRESQPN